MEFVPFNSQSFSTGATGTGTHFVGYFDSIMIYLSAVASTFASSAVEITLRGAHNSGSTALTVSIYDYATATPRQCVITASTAGYYEIPFAGAVPYVNLQFSTATTGAGTIHVVYGKS